MLTKQGQVIKKRDRMNGKTERPRRVGRPFSIMERSEKGLCPIPGIFEDFKQKFYIFMHTWEILQNPSSNHNKENNFEN